MLFSNIINYSSISGISSETWKVPFEYLMQFVLDNEAFPEVIKIWELFDPQFMEHV